MNKNKAIEKLLKAEPIEHYTFDKDIDVLKFNKYINDFVEDYRFGDLDTEDRISSDRWLIPTKYIEMDVEQYVLDLCESQEEKDRTCLELALYKINDLYPLLRLCVYISELAKDRGIIIGVGRGSSVCSYVLYLLGIHKVNPLKYDLPLTDFFKEIPFDVKTV